MKISKTLENAINTYQILQLKLIDVEIITEEVYKRNVFGERRKYVVPTVCTYVFSYNFLGVRSNITIVRLSGNSKSLETNIRAEILRDISLKLQSIQSGEYTQ